MFNYHIHTKRCGHATGEIGQYIEAAKKLGLREIGFSDHIPMYFLPKEKRDPTIAMSEAELPQYVEEILRESALCKDLVIKLGIEADYAPGYEKTLIALLKKYPFDYVLGSIHFLGNWGFDNPEFIEEYEKRDIEAIYTQYFQSLHQAIHLGDFDILAHPDLIKKFGFKPANSLMRVYEDVIKVIKEKDLCIEVNTAGLRVPAKEIYPSIEFLEICQHYNVPVTVGTDAHCPTLVGAGLEEAFKLIKDIGYRKIATFEKRRRKLVDFD